MTTTDLRNNPISPVSDDAAAAFEDALAQFQTYSHDPVATIEGALAEHPDFMMGHLLRVCLMLTAMEKGLENEIAASLAAAAKAEPRATDRERMHLAAARAWHAGDLEGASQTYLDIAAAYPRDIMALQVGHLCDFYMGNAGLLRDRIAAVLPAWSRDMPGYHAVLGMHAFGLEENADYRRAEDAGREAVELNRRDAWAIHAVAHVMEMEGRHDAGIEWMTSRTEDWATDNFFSVHNWWHLALYYLDLGDADAALRLYDERIRENRSTVVLDMVDASAMLWRLKLLDVDVGARWDEIADAWAPLVEDGFYAFNDVHAMMALVGAGRDKDAADLAARLDQVGAAHDGRANDGMTRDVGAPVAKALLAFGRGRYGDAASLLRSIRYRAHRFGGSNAQRDLVGWTLVEAALRDGQYGLATALINERTALKPSSLQNWRMAERAALGAGDEQATVLARERVRSLRTPDA